MKGIDKMLILYDNLSKHRHAPPFCHALKSNTDNINGYFAPRREEVIFCCAGKFTHKNNAGNKGGCL